MTHNPAAAVICPTCSGERRVKGHLCPQCHGAAQIRSMTAPSPPPPLMSAGELEKLEELHRANPIIAFENYGDGPLAISANKWPYIKAALDALPALLAGLRAQDATLAGLRAQVTEEAERNRDLLTENSTLHNKMASEYLQRTEHNDNYIMQSFNAYIANPAAWDTEAENRDFRPMRRAFDDLRAQVERQDQALWPFANTYREVMKNWPNVVLLLTVNDAVPLVFSACTVADFAKAAELDSRAALPLPPDLGERK